MQVIPSFSTARQSAMRRERKAGAKAENDRNSLHLLRIRNPWGHFEWEGDFGANSSLWTSDLRSRYSLLFFMHSISTLPETVWSLLL